MDKWKKGITERMNESMLIKGITWITQKDGAWVVQETRGFMCKPGK